VSPVQLTTRGSLNAPKSVQAFRGRRALA